MRLWPMADRNSRTVSGQHALSFVTPYWSGRDQMEAHLDSIGRFHPGAPILVSKRGGDREQMEAFRTAHGIEYWLEDCGYTDALLRLLQRCQTEFYSLSDHDAVLL